jgi:hypothetical protein
MASSCCFPSILHLANGSRDASPSSALPCYLCLIPDYPDLNQVFFLYTLDGLEGVTISCHKITCSTFSKYIVDEALEPSFVPSLANSNS